MPVLTRLPRTIPTASVDPNGSINCSYSLCATSVHPSEGINDAAALPQVQAGTASESAGSDAPNHIEGEDPTRRNPNAALDSYNHRMSTETTLGIIFVVVVVAVAIGLWIGLDKNLRRTLKRWVGCAGLRTKPFRHDAETSQGQGKCAPPVGKRGAPGLGDGEKVVRPMPTVLQVSEGSRGSSSSSMQKSMKADLPALPRV